jgi:predicted dehydrogenase
MSVERSPRPIRWGFLGTARIAEKISVAIQQTPGAELVAIASRDESRAKDWAARHQVPRAYGCYDALLDDTDLDVIYIPLPPALHPDWTFKALERGRHVLCEKPLADTADGAEVMVAAARQYHRLLMDGVMWRHHPRASEMRQVIAGGTLGTLRRVTSAFTIQAAALPADNLRFQRELGGGALLDLGWYCVGASLWSLGAVPTEVWGTARIQNDTDRSFSGTLWFPNDVIASFDCGFETVSRKWLEIAGTTGSLVCDDFTRPWSNDKARFWVHDQHGTATVHHSANASQEHCLVAEFCRRVRSGEWGCDWAEEALDVQRVCAALDESARTGRKVSVSK